MHLVVYTGRVDQQPRVVPHHHAAHMHLAGFFVHLDIGHPRGPGGAEAGPLTVHVACIGKALAVQPVAFLRLHLTRASNARAGVRQPARFIGRGLHQLDGARVFQQLQAKCDRVDPGSGGQLVNIRLVPKRVGQCRHAAQPGRAHDGRHVVDGHAQIVVVVRRAGRAVAHFVGLGHGLDGAREQQRQRGRAVGRVRGFKIVRGHRAIGVEPAAHLHQLGGALGLPEVFLLAGELHTHRRTHSVRQQRRIGRHVVSTVTAIAAGRFHANDGHVHIGHTHEAREIGAQDVGVLCAGPHGHAWSTWGVVRAPISHGA